MRANVYVDGFNLYYGCLDGSAWKWLDLRKFIEAMFPTYTVGAIKYFTAYLRPRPNLKETKAEEAKRLRQLAYITAIRTLPGVEVYPGHFLHGTGWRAEAVPVRLPNGQVMVEKGRPVINVGRECYVWDTEEKGSDVNLATHLLMDAWHDRYDTAIVVTNDSDQAYPVEVVRTELKRPVAVVTPVLDPDTRPPDSKRSPRKPSSELRQAANGFILAVDPAVLATSQLPNPVNGPRGPIYKPTVRWLRTMHFGHAKRPPCRRAFAPNHWFGWGGATNVAILLRSVNHQPSKLLSLGVIGPR